MKSNIPEFYERVASETAGLGYVSSRLNLLTEEELIECEKHVMRISMNMIILSHALGSARAERNK
jgi:hypothetical protein